MNAVGRTIARLALVLLAGGVACSDGDPVEPEPQLEAEDVIFAPSLDVDLSQMTRLESGVYHMDLDVPDPEAADVRPLFHLWVTYSGWLSDGTQFAAEEVFPDLRIGAGEVIPGWDLGLIGARLGATRRLVIPPAWAYGPDGGTIIPPNSVLVFDVQIDSIGPPQG